MSNTSDLNPQGHLAKRVIKKFFIIFSSDNFRKKFRKNFQIFSSNFPQIFSDENSNLNYTKIKNHIKFRLNLNFPGVSALARDGQSANLKYNILVSGLEFT